VHRELCEWDLYGCRGGRVWGQPPTVLCGTPLQVRCNRNFYLSTAHALALEGENRVASDGDILRDDPVLVDQVADRRREDLVRLRDLPATLEHDRKRQRELPRFSAVVVNAPAADHDDVEAVRR